MVTVKSKRRPHPLADDIRRVMEDGLADPLWTTNSLARAVDPDGTRHWYALQVIIRREAPAIAASLGLATYTRGPYMYFALPGRKINDEVPSLPDQIAAILLAAPPKTWTVADLTIALHGPESSENQRSKVARAARAAAESIGWKIGRYANGRAWYASKWEQEHDE